MGRLEGKVAVVTGGTGGIGRAVCELFAVEGAKVAALDVSTEGAEELLTALGDRGVAARFFEVDITREAEVAAAFARVGSELGPVDVLVNNAAVPGTSRLTHEATEEDFDRVFAVNVKGTFLCTKHALKSMIDGERKGSIVNVSSTYGLVGNADIPLYHATKAAVLMMARTDGVSYARHGIRVNAVLPGSTRSPMALAAKAISPEGAEYVRNLVAAHPMKRQAEPIEVARAVLFLAGDEASFVTGVGLPVDGGYTAQ